MKMENNRKAKEKYLYDFTYAGQEMSASEAKEIISKFIDNSGSVDLTEEINGIVKICLNNSRFKNSINAKMMFELEEIINKLEDFQIECKGVILYGADGNFCSGGDLNMARKMNNAEMGFAMATYMNHILEKFKRLPLITVAYIEGFGALGGGAELTTSCDYRLMCGRTESTVIGFVHAKMGIVPAWGCTGRLISIVGRQKTLDLLLECRLLNAAEASVIGLVDGTVNTLEDAAEWLSRKIVHDVNVIRAIKRMRTCYDNAYDWQTALRTERQIFAPLWGGRANQAALAKHLKHKK